MMNKMKIWVELDSGYRLDQFEDNALEFVAWLNGYINSVPQEFRKDVVFEIEHGRGYSGDFCSTSWKIGYWREETDEEYNDRLAEESRYVEKKRLAQLSHERAMYEQLKKKFEA